MAQVGIGTFDRVSFALVFHRVVDRWPIEHALVTLVIIAVVVMTLNTLSQHILEFSAASFGAHLPGKYAAGFPVDKGQDIDPVFFSSMKVYSSSISTV